MTVQRRRHFMTVAAAIVAAHSMLMPCVSAENRLANPSFEQPGSTPTPADWEAWSYPGTELRQVVDVARSGNAAARITVRDEGAEAFPLFCQRFAVRPGERWRGEVWARTEQVTSSWGPQLNFEFLDARGARLPFVEGGQAGGGTHDWVRLTAEAFVPPGATHLLFCAFTHGPGTVWFDDAELHRVAEPDAFTASSVTLRVDAQQVLNRNFLGFGCHGDNLLSLPINALHGVTEEDRALVRERVRAMRPALMRLFFDYQWWEPTPGHHELTGPALTALLDWIRFLRSIRCDVLIHPWGDQFAYSDWMIPEDNQNWWQHADSRLPIPAQRDAMVRSLVDFLHYARCEQQLDNIKYVALMNEPENDFRRPTPVDEFVRLNQLLSQCLAKRGLSEQVMLLGPDDCIGQLSGRSLWWNQTVPRALGSWQGLSSHTYKHRDTRLLGPWVADRLQHVAQLDPTGPPRPLLITEFGYVGLSSSTFENAENMSYEYGLFMGDFAIATLNSGASAALSWCLFDQYYDANHCQRQGLWQFKDQIWTPRPAYYSWSLVNRLTRARSQVVATTLSPECQHLRAAALLSPDNHLTLMVVNRYDRTIQVHVTSDTEVPMRRMRLFRYTPRTLESKRDALSQDTEVVELAANGSTPVLMPAQTLAILTDLPEDSD